MTSVSKKTVQLDIEINGKKAGRTYGSLIGQSRRLKKELYQLTPGTDAFIKKSSELRKVNTRLAQIRNTTKAAKMETSLWKKTLATFSVAAVAATAIQAFRSVISIGKEAFKLFDAQAKADAQLKAGIQSTNGAAKKSFEDLKREAAEFQKITLFGDEQTQEAQSVLLTFTNIQGEAFTRATKNTLDLATRLKVDLRSASIQVGKALNDPIKGVTALSRAGVQFTEDQKKMIKQMQNAGDIAGAQTIILKELETQFGGSAEAAAKAGNGQYTQFANRIGDVKEQVGLLINRGLKLIGPTLDAGIRFLEKFVDAVVNGTKATGEFSAVINFIIGYFKLLVTYYQTLYNAAKFIGESWLYMINVAKGLPFIGTIVQKIIGAFNFLIDTVTNTNAVFAGLKAGAKQAINNILRFMYASQIQFEIWGKQVEKALTINPATRKKIADDIAYLESLKTAAEKSGRTVGEAYAKGYENAIAEAAKKRSTASSGSDPVADPFTIPTGSTASLPSQTIDSQTKKATEKKQAKTAKQTRMFYDEMLKVSESFAQQRMEQLENEGAAELDAIQKKFLLAQLKEEEFNRLSMEQKLLNAENELAFLENLGLSETELFRKKELEKLAIAKEIRDQNMEDEKRAAEKRDMIQREGVEAFKDVINTGIDLLAKDEAARKKNAGAIKAFEAGRVLVNSYTEISELYKRYAAVPFGTAIASIKAIGVGVRAGLAISRINAAQFYRGGKVPHFTGQLIDHAQNIPTQPGGDNILATLKPGEVVLNQAQQNAIGGAAVFSAIGVPGFNTGGVALSSVNTTPSPDLLNSFDAAQGSGQQLKVFEDMNAAVGQLVQVLSNGPIMADISYARINEVFDEVAFIESRAQL